MINIYQLRSFYTCALHKNVTKAACELSVSQPLVSQQIKDFEEELGYSLFFRNGRQLELTARGRDLFEKSKYVFDSISRLQASLQKGDSVQPKVNLVVAEEIERPFVAKLTTELLKSDWLNNLQLTVSTFKDKSDVASLPSSGTAIFSNTEIEGLKLQAEFSFPVKLVSTSHGLDVGATNQLSLRGLLSVLGQKIILPSHGLALRAQLEEAFSVVDCQNEILMESAIIACISEGIRNGLGCGILPIQYVHDDLKRGLLSAYGPPAGFWSYKMYLYCSDTELTVFCRELKQNIKRYLVEIGGCH